MRIQPVFTATLLAAVLCASPGVSAEDLPEGRGWHKVWHDEFDGDEVDARKWRVEDAALVKNNERQYYAPDDVYVEEGALVLRSRKRAMGNREYTSGLVDTRGKFAQAFGRFEIRAKLPRTQGLWPAHWMLPADGSWPPEIDIMEQIGSEPNVITMSLHAGQWPNLDSQSTDHMGPDYSKDFHVYALEWEPGELRWFIDGVKRFSTQDQVPQVPMYFILNTAVGGDMPGDPDETTSFPQFHVIDYVRIYARSVPGSFFLTTETDGGKISITPADKENRYAAGAEVTLTARPTIGRRFARWSGDLEGSENPATLVMDGHKHIAAEFERDPNAPALLSRSAKVVASSVEDEKYPAEYVVDGDLHSRWSSEFSDPQTLTIDLGRAAKVSALRVVWENAHARDYRVDISDDGKLWRNIHTKKNSGGGTEEIVNIEACGRYVRLTGEARALEWGYSIWEFEVYGDPGKR